MKCGTYFTSARWKCWLFLVIFPFGLGSTVTESHLENAVPLEVQAEQTHRMQTKMVRQGVSRAGDKGAELLVH